MPRSRRPLAACAALVAALALTAVAADARPPGPGRARGPVAELGRAPAPATSLQAAPAAPTCGGERPPRTDGTRYVCTFDDDFSGSALDRGKWYVQDTAVTGVPADVDSCYVDRPSNVSVSGGVLQLSARRVAPFTCRNPFGAYTATSTAATIGSAGRFSQAYGRFEFRAAFPGVTVQGVHSALWLYPQDEAYGGWPDSGEIDVAEWFSRIPGNVYPSVHYRGEDPASSTGYDCAVPGAGTGYHRYAVEWTPSRIRMLYDGVECFSHTWTPDAPLSAPQPFDKAFYPVLTQVFGHGWNDAVAATPSSATMRVDWVRVWR